jgi:hypothetical protein
MLFIVFITCPCGRAKTNFVTELLRRCLAPGMTDAPEASFTPLLAHQEAYTLLYQRYVRLEAELSAALRALSQANTDTHMSARPSCSACDM